jgi:hypothetical protein
LDYKVFKGQPDLRDLRGLPDLQEIRVQPVFKVRMAQLELKD